MSPGARPHRLSGISGVLFVVCSFVAAGIDKQPPSWDQEGAVLVAWFAEHGQWYRRGHLVAGFAFFLWIVAASVALLRASNRPLPSA